LTRKRWARGEWPWVVSFDLQAGHWHTIGQHKIRRIRIEPGPDGTDTPFYNFDEKGVAWFLPDDLYRTWEEAEAEVRSRQIQCYGRDTRTEPDHKISEDVAKNKGRIREAGRGRDPGAGQAQLFDLDKPGNTG